MNKNLLQWLSGYLDGEGNFQVFPKKVVNTRGVITHYGVGVGFHLGLHIRDYALLAKLQSLFNGIGRLYKYEHKNEAHYAITSIAHLQWFVENVLDQCSLYTVHQYSRAQLLRHCIVNNIRRVETREEYDNLITLKDTFIPQLPLASDYKLASSSPICDRGTRFNLYLVGFINRERSFTTATTKNGGTVVKFALEHTDEMVLKLILNHMGFSTNVYSPTQRRGRKQTYALSVTQAPDLARVIDLLAKYPSLQGYKRDQYNRWLTTNIGTDWNYKQHL